MIELEKGHASISSLDFEGFRLKVHGKFTLKFYEEDKSEVRIRRSLLQIFVRKLRLFLAVMNLILLTLQMVRLLHTGTRATEIRGFRQADWHIG